MYELVTLSIEQAENGLGIKTGWGLNKIIWIEAIEIPVNPNQNCVQLQVFLFF